MSIRSLSLLVDAQLPVAVPVDVSDALERVEIDSAIGERGTFRLTFRVDRATLPERFLRDSGDLLRVVLVLDEGRGTSVIMDGVMVVHTLTTGSEGEPSLTVSGEDLTLLMDLVDVGRSFPDVPVEARVQALLAGYSAFGVVPLVILPPLPSTPIPAERIPHSRGLTTLISDCSLMSWGFGSRLIRAPLRRHRWRIGDPSLAPIVRSQRYRSISADARASKRFDSASTLTTASFLKHSCLTRSQKFPLPFQSRISQRWYRRSARSYRPRINSNASEARQSSRRRKPRGCCWRRPHARRRR
jgi:hypothetical protein